jgi:uncharacterized small protein (TIGR04563 family)
MSNDKVEQALYWPEAMLQFLQDQGVRLDRSLSWIVQRALTQTLPHIAACDREQIGDETRSTDLRGGDKRKQTLFFPKAMLDEVKDHAARLDSSMSWVAQAAVVMARAEIEAIAVEATASEA